MRGGSARALARPVALALALALALAASAPGRAAEAPPPAGEPPAPLLGYCAPPVVPACLDGLKGHPELVKACAVRAEAYEVTVFAYRICLNRETERAVREANGAMGKLRCAQGRRVC